MLQPAVQYIAFMIAFTVRAQLLLSMRARSPALKVEVPSEEPRGACPRDSSAAA